MKGLALLLVLVVAVLGDHHQLLADPPECPDPVPGVALNATFYPNEDDCSKYWLCDNGNLYNGSCSDDLVWNPNLDSCDWPYNYDCPYDKMELVLPIALPVQEIECPQPSPDGSVNATFYPNEEDCSKYWQCANGELINGTCGDDLVWNPIINNCDWPYNYDCPYGKKEFVLPNALPVQEIECPQPSPDGSVNATFYPNEEDCTKYWQCANGELINGTCGDDLVWNPIINNCDWPYNYDCPYGKKEIVLPNALPVQEIECPQPSADGSVNVTFYPNVEDCTKYWQCANGELINGTCGDDLVWNPTINNCDWPYNYDCPYDKMELVLPNSLPVQEIECPPPSADGKVNVTFFPNEEDCTKYWQCDNGELINATCGNDLVWNPIINNCDWPYNYDCPYDKRKSIPGVVKFVCQKISPRTVGIVVYYPNENDIQKYWECLNGEARERRCDSGKVWDTSLKKCVVEFV